MRRRSQPKQRLGGERGFSIIEVLVAVVILIVFVVGTVQFFASASNRVMDSETRTLLHQIAAQEIEEIRALPYEAIGTVGGQPQGDLLDEETTTVDGVPVQISREIVYVQDPSYEGPYPANYRRVTVVVRATDSDELAPMQLSSIIAGGATGGTLDITVTDTSGQPVAGARLRVENDHLIPHVDIYTAAVRTDSQGHLLVPGLTPDGTNSYYVTASKTGYDSAATPQGQVLGNGTPFTVVQLIIDRLSSLTVHVTDEYGAPRPGVDLTVSGQLSVDPWAWSVQVATDDSGLATLTGIRYGTSLQPCIIQTTATYPSPLALPSGVEPDPIDPGITLGLGQVGIILDPGIDRTVDLVLPTM